MKRTTAGYCHNLQTILPNRIWREKKERLSLRIRRLATGCAVIVTMFALVGMAFEAPAGEKGHDLAVEKDHDHAHDFEAMDDVSVDDMGRAMSVMMDIGLVLPPMDSHRGRALFVDKGCIVCHAVNGVGGEIGPSLNARDMPVPMNAFEFAARMWRGAPTMVAMQEDLLGQVISLSGQDIADLVAFAHDAAEQAELTAAQIPTHYGALIEQQRAGVGDALYALR